MEDARGPIMEGDDLVGGHEEGAVGGQGPAELTAVGGGIQGILDGPRRSSRANLGQPPNLYGEWEFGGPLPGMQGQQRGNHAGTGGAHRQMGVNAWGAPRLSGAPGNSGDLRLTGAASLPLALMRSTHQTATGQRLTRTTVAAPSNIIFRRRVDDDAESTSSAASERVALYDEQIQKREISIRQQLEELALLQKIRDEEADNEEQQLSEDEEEKQESEDKVNSSFENVDPSTILGEGKGAHTLHTPCLPIPIWKKNVKRPRDPPPKPPRTSTPNTGWEKPPPPEYSTLFGERTQKPPLQKQQIPEVRAGVDPNYRRLGTRFGGAPPPPPQPEVNFADALAQAMVTALAAQNQNTERFVARQSGGSSLPSFGGNPLDWPIFAHHYGQSTRDCGFTSAQNMARLEKALKGEARRHVRALMIVPDNAEAVMTRLEQRYWRPEFVVQALVEIARKTPTPKEGKLSSIVDFAGAINNLVTTIGTLRIPSYLNNPQLMQELVEKLPDNLKLQWGMKALDFGSCTLVHFAEWIDRVAEAASKVSAPKLNFRERKDESSFATEEVPSRKKSCLLCEADHQLTSCEKYKKLENKERWNIVKKNNLCFRCLRANHSIKDCRSTMTCRVEGCNKRHNTLLHGPPHIKSHNENKDSASDLNATMTVENGGTLLRIVVVRLYGKDGQELTCNALLDEGSTVTLISSEVADCLGLGGIVDPLRIKWTDGTVQSDNSSRKVDLWIGPDGGKEKYTMRKVRTVRNLRLPSQRTDLKDVVEQHPYLQRHRIRYLPGERPLILIGQPHIHLSVAREVEEKDDESPILTKTKLGWVIHGPNQGDSGMESAFLCHHETDDDLIHNLVKESFSLESIGIKSTNSCRSREDILAEERMKVMTRRVGDRWETGLLWRQEPVTLPKSREVALSRLHGIERKFKRNENLASQYKEKIAHYLECGYARKLSEEELQQSSNVEWYLPHFDCTHPNKPGKIRIVFDAASRSQGVSLNDYLLTGPDLLVSLPGVLVKFRQRKVAFSGDITEMFHQVRIRKEDCPAQRILWREQKDEEPSTYQFGVMMFGSVCSPFCAQYVKNANALEFVDENPKAVDSITKLHYMDDWLQSVDTEDEALNLVLGVKDIHHRGGFEIGKWISNSRKLLEKLKSVQSTAPTKDLAEWSEIATERVLGLHWLPSEDMFTFKVNLDRAGIGIATGEVVPTKRIVLRLVMLIWDPLGFLGHYLITARILLQDLWRTKIGWDDQLTAIQFGKWKKWVLDLPQLSRIRIRRCYSSFASRSPDVSLHIFADSSAMASCVVAYLRVLEENREFSVTLVMAKARVAPVKPCSVPKMELNAAHIASRMGKFLQSQLDVTIHGVTYWTDSMTTLRWIRAEARRFQQFVSVRVGEIQENSEISQWRWVSTQDNPADDGTRDGRADLGDNSRWFCGPEFLRHSSEDFPKEPLAKVKDEGELLELRKEYVALQSEVPVIALPDVSRFSNYMRLVRSSAMVLKFIEMEMLLFRRSQWESFPQEMQHIHDGDPLRKSSSLFQLSPVLDHDGVLRMNSRLVSAEEEGIRLPIILSSKNDLTKLLLRYYHKLHQHAGEDLIRNEVRQRFWIPKVRSSIRKVIRECLLCRKRKVQGQTPMMGAIPNFKIQPQPRPFNICGMDYFGPMEVTVGRRHEKRYGVLFTCMNTRAVHLEVAHSLATDSCILAIRRMIARRGQPTQMWSDNGTNLKSAEKELRLALEELDPERITGELDVQGTEWHFIPPAAPHMGGSWERLVRSVKTALKVIMTSRAPKDEVLVTLFTEAEATVNSRPLVEVPVDPESPEALTPFHFLIGTSSHKTPPGDFDVTNIRLDRQWRQSQALADLFWKRWVREYVPTLQRRAKWHKEQPSICVGDVVVVLDESLKRNSWPLGIVTHIFPGKDGVVRVAEVKTDTGTYRRPVVKLGKLDVRKDDQDKD